MAKTSNPIARESIALHTKLKGKIKVVATSPLRKMRDLSLLYTPGVGAVSSVIAAKPSLVDTLTWRQNTVAIVSDGSAVLGLGNIGPFAALPVMEGKSAIFARFTGINAVPLVLATQDTEEIIQIVKALEPSFGAIQLEDISAPRCFEIERRLEKELSIPVMHDDQHGTAIVVLAGLLNATKVVKKKLSSLRVVVTGAGAAGTAIAHLLSVAGVKDIVLVDRTGILSRDRKDLNPEKQMLVATSNPRNISGDLAVALQDADVVVGTSGPGVLSEALVRLMAPRAIVFALANPIPEIMPDVARKAGAMVVATGRSDFPNQVNNALCYPGLFRGLLDKRVNLVSDAIKLRAAHAIAGFVKKPTPDRIIPNIFDKGLHEAVARSVKK